MISFVVRVVTVTSRLVMCVVVGLTWEIKEKRERKLIGFKKITRIRNKNIGVGPVLLIILGPNSGLQNFHFVTNG